MGFLHRISIRIRLVLKRLSKKLKLRGKKRKVKAEQDIKPFRRSPEEIKKAYGHSIETTSAAVHARDALVERQEKLKAINRRTEDLERSAEDFASTAKELERLMRSRKWWQI